MVFEGISLVAKEQPAKLAEGRIETSWVPPDPLTVVIPSDTHPSETSM